MKKQILPLQSCRKEYTYDQDKACSPEETVDRFYGRLKKTNLEILKEVKRIDTGRLDIPVYFSVCGNDARRMIGNKKQMGKGSTPAQSRASACMELAERFSFFSFINDAGNFITGDYQQMVEAGYPVMELETLLHAVHDESLPPETLTELLKDLPMQWTWTTRLSDMSLVLVPFSWFYAINEFNGPSAGNTFEEAVIQGVSEIIERHVCALIARDKINTPAINPDSVTDPVALKLLKKFQDNNIKVYLNDFSLGTGIPTVGALAYDPATFPEKSEIVYTAGTTPGANKALIRALTEVAQLAGDFETGSNYVASGLPKPLSLDEVSYIIEPEEIVTIDEIDDLQNEDIFQEIKNCIDVVSTNMNTDIFIINTTHTELDIPALYTIIPGAHFRERAMSGSAAMFAAKLSTQLLSGSKIINKLKQMEKLLPTAYFLKFYQGKELYENGNYIDAKDYFLQALKYDPNEEDIPYIYSYLGSCLRDLACYDEAIEVLQKGLDKDEERPDIHNTIGVCYFKCEQFEKAVYHFTRAVELNPVSAIDYANLALNYEKLSKYDAAIENYEIALSQDPTIEFAIERLGNLLALQNR